MSLSRRQVIALVAAAPVLASLAAGGVVARVWDQPAADGLRHLSASEAEFLRALAGAAWPANDRCPLDGAAAGLDVFFDSTLDTLPELPRTAARAGLHALDALPLSTDGDRFSALTPALRTQKVEAWLNSDSLNLRSAVTSLVLVLGMGYTIHQSAAPAFSRLYRCGYGP